MITARFVGLAVVLAGSVVAVASRDGLFRIWGVGSATTMGLMLTVLL